MAVLFQSVHSDPLLIFFVQLALTLALTRVLSKAFGYLGQPLVIGEILAGVIMGPSVMGRIPGFTAAVWPTAVPQGPGKAPYDSTITFNVIADVGVVLFMFLLGCELDHHRMQTQWKTSIVIALSAIIFPFAVGAANGLWLEDINNENQPPGFVPPRHRSFMLFTGTSMSFTAFPVLASLLTTMDLLHSPIGLQALSCAAVDDVMAWCTLALASSFAQSANALEGLYTTLGAIGYIAIMVVVVRPGMAQLHKLIMRRKALDSPYYMTFIFLMLIASAFTTEALGIHAFFGSFVMGLCVPKEGGFAEGIAGRMELVVADVLLPLFFASSGIKTDIGTIDTWRYWGVVLALVCIATSAKFLPGCLMSKVLLRNRSWRFCSALGLLMNTRGLVEMIALNIGLSMGILTTRMFSMMVLMAISTTWMTGPSLLLLYRGRQHELRGDGLPDHDACGSADTADGTLPTQAPSAAETAADTLAVTSLSPASSAGGAPPVASRHASRSITLLYKQSDQHSSNPGTIIGNQREVGKLQLMPADHAQHAAEAQEQERHGPVDQALAVSPLAGTASPPAATAASADRGWSSQRKDVMDTTATAV